MSSNNVWVKLYGENSTVTTSYLKAIGGAYEALGRNVHYFMDEDEPAMKKNDTVVIATAIDAFKLHLRGFRHIAFWSQGVWPEESFLRHESRLRLTVCDFVEKKALVWAEKVFLVSNAMFRHYEEKYSIGLAGKSFVTACSNEEIHPNAFAMEGKYSRPIFTYAGSLVAYQCIDQMLCAYAKARAVFPEARLLFFTNEVEEAERKVAAMGLEGVIVDSRPQDQLWKYVAEAKYGFVLREDSVINRVATPTKISTYLANGVIPIYGSCIEAFSETSEGILRLKYNEETFVDDLRELETMNIAAEDIFNQYSDYFAKYLSLADRANDMIEFLAKGSSK